MLAVLPTAAWWRHCCLYPYGFRGVHPATEYLLIGVLVATTLPVGYGFSLRFLGGGCFATAGYLLLFGLC